MGAEGSNAVQGRYAHPFLRDTVQSPAQCSAGVCAMPILYNDSSQVFLFYRVPLAAAAGLIPDPRLEPLPVFGAAIAGLAAFEYRDTSAGPYNEVAVTVLARRRGTAPSWLRYLFDPAGVGDAAFYVASLPVTTELARAAGADFWGFPKYVTTIATRFAPDQLRIELGGELNLDYRSGPGLTLASPPLATFSVHHGQLERTLIRTHGAMHLGRGAGASLSCVGDGPTAHCVRALGLEQRKPFAVCRVDPFRAILPFGSALP